MLISFPFFKEHELRLNRMSNIYWNIVVIFFVSYSQYATYQFSYSRTPENKLMSFKCIQLKQVQIAEIRFRIKKTQVYAIHPHTFVNFEGRLSFLYADPCQIIQSKIRQKSKCINTQFPVKRWKELFTSHAMVSSHMVKAFDMHLTATTKLLTQRISFAPDTVRFYIQSNPHNNG